MRKPSVEVHIENLLLEGFPVGDRHRIGEALKAELTRLLAAPWQAAVLAQSGRIAALDGGSFSVTRKSGPDRLGIQAARAVHKSLDSPGSAKWSPPRKGGQ